MTLLCAVRQFLTHRSPVFRSLAAHFGRSVCDVAQPGHPDPMTTDPSDITERFFALHHRAGKALLLPNPWDAGSARLLAHLGFEALATTSSGAAAARGLLDGDLGRDAALEHAATIVGETDLPVSADLENGFADDPDGVGDTVRLALDTGLAGCSIEDYSGADDRIYDAGLAAARVEAAADAAHGGPRRLVLTARAENHIRGHHDLADTISRLQSFEEAGADVLYAPGIVDPGDIRSVVDSVDLPVNVLARPGLAPVAELAQAGVRRISVGGAFAFAALAAMADAAEELLGLGTYGFLSASAKGSAAARRTFGPPAG